MTEIGALSTKVNERLAAFIQQATLALNELTLEIKCENLVEVCLILRDEAEFDFNLLVDVCGVDYLYYGLSEWETNSATFRGFERGVDRSEINHPPARSERFAVVYHLLSLSHGHRIRLRVFLQEENLEIPTVTHLWPAANWFEREAFDLFGIIFKDHADLRRLLTDYGFVGHPFRKDFPLSGNVEVRYDAALQRVIYEPVSIVPRILEPKVIRHDNRYKIGDT